MSFWRPDISESQLGPSICVSQPVRTNGSAASTALRDLWIIPALENRFHGVYSPRPIMAEGETRWADGVFPFGDRQLRSPRSRDDPSGLVSGDADLAGIIGGFRFEFAAHGSNQSAFTG